MGRPQPPRPAKLFIAMLSSEQTMFELCRQQLCEQYGAIDMATDASPWNFTDYYSSEMGLGLLRKFIFFEKLIDPAELASVKNFTNQIETDTAIVSSGKTRRRINLDPGYLTEAKVVLASTKDYSHRIYIGGNIYAEVTLRYRRQSFEPLEHTYPDYRSSEYIEMFNKARELLRVALTASAKDGRSRSSDSPSV